MGKQIVVKDETYQKLQILKQRLKKKSLSEAIEYLLHNKLINLRELVALQFSKLAEDIGLLIEDLEILELTRVLYIIMMNKKIKEIPKELEYTKKAVVKLLNELIMKIQRNLEEEEEIR